MRKCMGAQCTYDMIHVWRLQDISVESFFFLLPCGTWSWNSVLELGDPSFFKFFRGKISPFLPPSLFSLLHSENQCVSYQMWCQAEPSTPSGAKKPVFNSSSSVVRFAGLSTVKGDTVSGSSWLLGFLRCQPQSGVLWKWECIWLNTRHARKLVPAPGKVRDPALNSLTVTGHSGRSYLHGVGVFSFAACVSRVWEFFFSSIFLLFVFY